MCVCAQVGQAERGVVTDGNKAEYVALKVRQILVEDRYVIHIAVR